MNRTIIPIACVLAPKSAQMWNNGYVLSHFAFVKPETLSSGGREKMSSDANIAPKVLPIRCERASVTQAIHLTAAKRKKSGLLPLEIKVFPARCNIR